MIFVNYFVFVGFGVISGVMLVCDLVFEFINIFGNIFKVIFDVGDIFFIIVRYCMFELLFWLVQCGVKFKFNDDYLLSEKV